MTAVLIDGDDWLTVREVAAYLSCSEKSVRRMIADGTLPVLQAGRQHAIRIRRSDVERALVPIDPSEFRP